ncbi:metal ABC transporter permease [Alkalihalobacterium alkalinitrilicum]|uniref:metal ABC transporter permease n=1 Tax=Alkalihalobacterium alkalinitrilicum TaxID=427920 RepID=UPI0011528DFA|nr:metal ABC transporter permease [Alkalihalobacterium alkalinitrilicum]
MLEILSNLSFIERGMVAAGLIGFICPLLGAFLLVRRISIISESLSHITLTGIAAGVLLTSTMTFFSFINPLYFGLVFAFIGSLLIERLRQVYRDFQEIAIPIILSTGVGLSAIIISISKTGYNQWFMYLFGSIVSVTLQDLYFMILTSIVVLIILTLFYKEFVAISFDQEFAKVSGISIRGLNFIFSFLIALVIALSMKVVGILLVGAMIVLPAASAIIFAKSFKSLLWLSVLFGQLAMLTGSYFSYHLNIATGGGIVLFATVWLIVAHLLHHLFKGKRKERVSS